MFISKLFLALLFVQVTKIPLVKFLFFLYLCALSRISYSRPIDTLFFNFAIILLPLWAGGPNLLFVLFGFNLSKAYFSRSFLLIL